MKRARIILVVVLVADMCVAFVASAKGLLPGMVYRRGLTNEQIDGILDKHPSAQLRITAQDWRGMRYQLYRFHNMTNYVELIGSTQDCARVLLRLHDATETLSASNSVLARVAKEWRDASEEWHATADAWRSEYAVATNNLHAAIADYMNASNRASRANARHKAVVDWCEEQRDKALLPTTKALWQSFIDKLNEDGE